MDNWTFEYIFHSLKIQILRNWSKRAERNGDQNYHIYHKKKKKNHLGKKVTTIKFWDKKWRVFWRISSKLGKVWYLGRFSFLPSLGNRKKCAGGKDEVYNVLPTFSHVFPGENTGYNGEGRSRAQWRGSRVRATVYRYSFIIGRWKIVVSPIRL